MNKVHKFSYLAVLLSLLVVSQSQGYELAGSLSFQGRFFPGSPLYEGQKDHNGSFSLSPRIYQDRAGRGMTFAPFFRADSADDERTHFDIREFMFFWYGDTWEARAGIGRVFWGVTESQHLVDIINQTDLVEAIDGEEKLGQPMLSLSLIREWGTIDLFFLPYFRERTFPGGHGRLRSGLLIDTDLAEYESAAEEFHLDYAARYSNIMGKWEIGLSHFRGTIREPTFHLAMDGAGRPVLFPFYEQGEQTGVDLQVVADRWLWKLEAIYRSGQGEGDFYAHTLGFEYTISSLLTAGRDVSILAEWLYDERGDEATWAFDNDVMTGTRIVLNDEAGTEALLGLIHDLSEGPEVFFLESGRRLTDYWKLSFEAFFVLHSPEGGFLHDIRKDDYIQIDLTYYF